MIDFVIAGAVRCDAVFSVDLPLCFPWNVAHFFGISRDAEILGCNIECIAGSESLIGNEWRGLLLGEGYLGEKQQ